MIHSVHTVILPLIAILHACAHQQLSYKNDIHPIFDNHCNSCHTAPYGSGYKLTGLEMNTYHALMNGTIYGLVVIPGDSRRSILNKLVEGRAGNMQNVLHNTDNEGISSSEIEHLKIWVDQGALDN